MDRVLLVTSDQTFSSHIEKTVNQIGLDVSVCMHETELYDFLNEFKPSIVVVKGDNQDISSLAVGKVLRDRKYDGRVILILDKDQKVNPDDLNQVKMDFLLFEPVGAIKVISHILDLMTEQRDVIRNRLLKMVDGDKQFRNKEESFLVSSGKSLNQEITHVRGKIKSDSGFSHVKGGQSHPQDQDKHISSIPDQLSAEDLVTAGERIKNELKQNEVGLRSKIDKYNQAIQNIDIPLSTGHKKRHTHAKQKDLRKEHLIDPGQEKLDNLDSERKKFANALMKKDKSKQ